MKKAWVILLLIVLFTGCSSAGNYLQRGVDLRERLLQGNGCSFKTEITADYGDKTYCFTMQCSADTSGNIMFSVLEPESIAGITGTLCASGGQLTFDDTALAFEMLAEGEVSPVSAPWILIHALQGGYLSSCGMEGDSLRLTIDDSYEQDALQLDIWLDSDDLPDRAEILWQGRRVLSLDVDDFTFL